MAREVADRGRWTPSKVPLCDLDARDRGARVRQQEQAESSHRVAILPAVALAQRDTTTLVRGVVTDSARRPVEEVEIYAIEPRAGALAESRP
jgi:hypothetical protein